jgi:hypothetical protein
MVVEPSENKGVSSVNVPVEQAWDDQISEYENIS